MRTFGRFFTALWGLSWALGLLAPAPLAAATVEIVVRDQFGEPLAGEWVGLAPDVPAPHRRLETDREGRVRFAGLPPGGYAIELLATQRLGLVAPQHNPFVPPQRFTLVDEGETLTVALERWQGRMVRNRFDLPDQEWSRFGLRFTHLATGKIVETAVPQGLDHALTALPAGLWRFEAKPPDGYLLVGLEVDGEPLPGAAAELDLALAGGSETALTWSYAAPSFLFGKVSSTGTLPPFVIEATLLEGGPWLAAARRRGGSQFDVVRVPPKDQGGNWEMKLPDGIWRVRVASDAVAESQPEELVVELAAGAARRVDFSVKLKESDDEREGTLTVQVQAPSGQPVEGAVVQAFALGEGSELRPLASTRSGRFGIAKLDALPPGDLLLVAGHREFLEATLRLGGFKPREAPEALPMLELGLGARLRFAAEDRAGKAMAGAELRAVLLEVSRRAPPSLLRDPALVAAKADRSVLTDHSGRVVLAGLEAGRYRLEARRPAMGSAFVLLRVAGGRPEPALELEIEEGATLEIEGFEAAASRLRFDLACADGWPLPELFDVRVIGTGAELPVDATGRLGPGDDAAFAGQLRPAGPERRTLEVGPLGDGDYRLAIRPAGFDRWTWSGKTHDPAASLVLPIRLAHHQGDGIAALPDFDLECGPALDLLPRLPDGRAWPRLDQLHVEAEIRHRDDERAIAPPPEVAAGEDSLLLRGLEPGEGRLIVELQHVFLLPEPRLTWEIPVKLENGRFRELILDIEGLGGALVAQGPGRLVALDGAGRRFASESPGERLLLPSLPAGRYAVELLDPAGKLLKRWDAVDVAPGATRALP